MIIQVPPMTRDRSGGGILFYLHLQNSSRGGKYLMMSCSLHVITSMQSYTQLEILGLSQQGIDLLRTTTKVQEKQNKRTGTDIGDGIGKDKDSEQRDDVKKGQKNSGGHKHDTTQNTPLNQSIDSFVRSQT
jgi:hypothetical protein